MDLPSTLSSDVLDRIDARRPPTGAWGGRARPRRRLARSSPRRARAACRLALTLGLAVAALLGGGCARHVYSPPTRAMPFDDALGPGAGQANLQVGGASSGAVFGPHVASGAVQVEYGATERVDLVGSGTWMHLSAQDSDPRAVGDPDRNALSGRAGVRLALFDSRLVAEASPRRPVFGLALLAGAGGGASRVGTFIAPDLGVAASLRTDTGFDITLGARTWTSVPVVRRSFGWSDGTSSNLPNVTFGAGFHLQGAVPLVIDDEGQGEAPVRLVGGIGLAWVTDGAEPLGFLQLGGALEVRLR